MKLQTSIFIFSLALFIASCNGDSESSDKKIFRYNSSSGITSLDPAFAKDQANIWAVNMLYSGLIQFDENLNIEPCLAKKWSISDDGLTYTFHLRSDVYFHAHELFPDGKGRKVTATDVAYSLQRIVDPATASPGLWIFNGRVDAAQPFTAKDDTTFQIKLLKPFRPMLSILTMQYTYIVPKEVAEHYGKDFRVHPVGTGPFKFKVWQESDVLILTKNENYFEQGLPCLDGVKVSFIQSKQTEYLNFLKGDLDFLSGVDASYINDLLTQEGELKEEHSTTISMYKTPYLNSEYLGFLMDDRNANLPNNPLKIKEVRQAINYGFDREAVIRYLRNSIGKPANSGFVPFGLPSFNAEKVKGYSHNPEKAKQLLVQAGFSGGKGLPEIPLYTSKTYEDIATYLQSQLRDIGIPVRLEIVLPAFQRELMSKSQAPFFRGSWIADYPDAESYLAMFYSKHGAPPNYTRFSDAQFDNLYEQALNENDDALRYSLYQKMDSILMENAVVVPLFYDEVIRFVRKGVDGLEPNAMNLLNVKRVKISE
ncbi:MAG: ABC transporter substrate-binding protein [Chitinophagales bacterium]|nr:ABC transporter substrate-binding protein [Chitinophagales bacterium]